MEYWYANGQARSNLGYVGFDGANRFVVSYLFTVPSGGASSVSVRLSGIGSQHGSNPVLGVKIGTTPSQYANAGSGTTPDGSGSLSYSSGSLWNGTITASGLNLPAGQYYATVYSYSAYAGYWSQWVSGAEYITTSGSYTPTSSEISSVTSPVNTQDNVTIVMNNPGGLTHTASFYYGSTLLATSESFTNTLSYTCPRSWFANNISVTTMSIKVIVTSSTGGTDTEYFTLNADSGMKPIISSVTCQAVNPSNLLTGYISNVSRVQATFGNVDMSATASAEIRTYKIEVQGTETTGASPILSGVITGSCSVNCTVTDSRGRTGTYSVQITAKAYVAPTLTNISAIRCTSAGTASETGTSVKVNATAVYSSLDGENAAQITVYAKQTSSTYSQVGTIVSGTETRFDNVFSASYAYIVKLEVTDTAGGTNYYEIALDFEKWMQKFTSTGNGVAFGQAPSTDYELEIPTTWIFAAGGAKFGNEKMVLVNGKHFGTSLPATGEEGQIFFQIV